MKSIDEFVRLQEAARNAIRGDGLVIHDFLEFAMASEIGRIAQDLAVRLERIRAIGHKIDDYDCTGEQGPNLRELFYLTDTAKPLGEK